jgi:hypothetical protein
VHPKPTSTCRFADHVSLCSRMGQSMGSHCKGGMVLGDRRPLRFARADGVARSVAGHHHRSRFHGLHRTCPHSSSRQRDVTAANWGNCRHATYVEHHRSWHRAKPSPKDRGRGGRGSGGGCQLSPATTTYPCTGESGATARLEGGVPSPADATSNQRTPHIGDATLDDNKPLMRCQ